MDTQRSSPVRRIPIKDELIRLVQRNLTDRDVRICHLLDDHRVLTAHQLATAFFPSGRAARERLIVLYRNRVLDRFRPHTELGSSPYHYTLDVLGAAVCEADRDEDPTMRRRRARESWQRSSRLAHLLDINSFFTDLLGQERRTNEYRLIEWWSEARCAREMAGLAYPDAFGEWSEDSASTEFYLEVDRGTENSSRLREKLVGYQRLRHSTGIDRPVLFWVQTERRERSVRSALAGASIPIATAVKTHEPWALVWRQLGESRPRRLIEL